MELALSQPQLIKVLLVADIAPVAYSNRHQQVFAALNSIDLNKILSRKDALKSLTDAGIDNGTAQFLLKNLIKEDNRF